MQPPSLVSSLDTTPESFPGRSLSLVQTSDRPCSPTDKRSVIVRLHSSLISSLQIGTYLLCSVRLITYRRNSSRLRPRSELCSEDWLLVSDRMSSAGSGQSSPPPPWRCLVLPSLTLSPRFFARPGSSRSPMSSSSVELSDRSVLLARSLPFVGRALSDALLSLFFLYRLCPTLSGA